MILTEAFAAATPVLASDIPGYRDVVRDFWRGAAPIGDFTDRFAGSADLYQRARDRGHDHPHAVRILAPISGTTSLIARIGSRRSPTMSTQS